MSLQRLHAKLRKRSHYKAVFGGESAKDLTLSQETVLKDLANYCHSHRTTMVMRQDGTVDPIASAVAEGRRQVFLRILALSQLPDSAILQAIERESNNE